MLCSCIVTHLVNIRFPRYCRRSITSKLNNTNKCVILYIMKQLDHYETLEKMPKMSMDCILFICGITCDNLGLILRSADIFGVKTVYYRQGENSLNNKNLIKLSRGSNIQINIVDSIEPLKTLKNNGYNIIALEITSTSISLRKLSLQQQTCLVVGNEQKGIPAEILELADISGHIDMIGGHISSLNVSIATSIALYEISQKHLANAV